MKINFKALGQVVAKTSKRFGPAVAIVVGAVTTAYGSYKMAQAIPVAKQHISEKKAELGKEKLTVKETVEACGKDILGPAAMMVGGAAGVAGGLCGYEKAVGTLTNAVGVANAFITEQENAIVQAVGPERAKEIQQEVVKNVTEATNPKNDISSIGIATTQYPDELFLEPFTGRWLMASETWLEKCALAVYKNAVKSAFSEPIMVSSLYDTWTAGGSGATDSVLGDYIGWTVDTVNNCNPIDISFAPKRMSDGRMYKEITYSTPAKFIGM